MKMEVFMKSKLYTLLFLTATVILFSCKTAKKMYEKGNYDEAVELAAKKLQKKPNDAATLDILQNAYRFAVEDHEARIRNNANSNNDLRWEWTYSEYLDLQRLYDAIRKSPSVFDIIRPTDYSSYVVTFQEEAGNARYDRGLALMQNNNKNSFRQAYYEFQRALDLKPGDISARQKLDEAYTNAVTNVIVLPVFQSGFQHSSFNYGFVNIDNNILRYLNNNNSNSFVRYYSPAEASSFNIRTDQFVEMRFSDIDIDRYRDQRSTREVSKQVVVKETVIKPDSIIREYATVKAKINTTRRTLQSDGLMQVMVRDYNDQWLWNDTYRGDYNWSTEFSTYTGDARALSEEDKKLLDCKEQFPPVNQEIIRIIMNEIQTKAECGIKDYFNRF
jgi:tetratricopeptide (TPR) repeat protein